jgi:riboflavin kinase/FMN adenylyltransferase
MMINKSQDLVLNINKPAGITSFKAVAMVRRALGIKKVGHAGTLDPFATGVLVICTNRASRIIEYLMESKKEYRALIEFGTSTDTGDSEGSVIQSADASGLDHASVEAALKGFQGAIMQKPHPFSAVRHKGKRLYDLARAGKTPEIKARPVFIHSLNVSDFTAYKSETGRKIRAYLDVVCSKGTYIRSLTEDIGKTLGLPAYTVELKRIASGNFRLENSINLPEGLIEKNGPFARILSQKAVSIEQALEFMPLIKCMNQFYDDLKTGKPLMEDWIDYQDTRIGNEDIFLLKTNDSRLIGLHRYHGPNQRGFKKKQLSKPVKILARENTGFPGFRIINNPEFKGADNIPADMKRVVCLGNFDGMHLGHMVIIKKAVHLAAKTENFVSSVLFFDPHPEFVIKGKNPGLLMSLDDKIARAFELGIDQAIVFNFDTSLAGLAPDAFVRDIIFESAGAVHVITGFNYRFGKHAAGDVQDLGRICSLTGISVHASRPVMVDNIVVSSTIIREFIKKGEIRKANQFLGINFRLKGRVKHGFKRGRALGFPTANIGVENINCIIPGPGVYCCKACVDKRIYAAAVSIGNNPTFQSKGEFSLIEAHLIEYTGDLYDKILDFEFCEKLRNIVKYDSPEKLARQIKKDIESVKSVISANSRVGSCKGE